MTYILKQISPEDHDDFLQNSNIEHFMQTSAWAKVKSLTWKNEFIGLYDNEVLVASTLLLYRKMPLFNKYIYYAPRGFIIDYANYQLLEIFTDKIKNYLKQRKCCYLIVDPDVPYHVYDNKRNLKTEDQTVYNNLINLKYLHQGFNYFFENTQPRYTFRLDLQRDYAEVYQGFSKIIRTTMKNNRNYFECFKTNDLNIFYNILNDTAKRDNFIEPNIKYYQTLVEYLKPQDMVDIYVARYLPKKHLKFIDDKLNELNIEKNKIEIKLTTKPEDKKSINRIDAINTQVNKQMQIRKEVLEAIELYPDGIDLASGLTIHTKHRAWLVYGGNLSLYRDVCANYAIKEYEIQDDILRNFEFVDFFGTIGIDDKSSNLYGIHDFKRKFNGDLIEFPGEFHLIINKLTYKLWIKIYPFALKLIKKIKITFHK